MANERPEERVEIANLNMDDIDIQELEQRIELAAMDVTAMLMKPCMNFGYCLTYGDVCNGFLGCGTYT